MSKRSNKKFKTKKKCNITTLFCKRCSWGICKIQRSFFSEETNVYQWYFCPIFLMNGLFVTPRCIFVHQFFTFYTNWSLSKWLADSELMLNLNKTWFILFQLCSTWKTTHNFNVGRGSAFRLTLNLKTKHW